MPRPTRRFAALAGGAALLFLIGTNIQSGWLFVLSALLAGTALGGLLVPALMVRGIDVRRIASAEATQGAPARVRLDVSNRSRGMRWMLLLDDEHLEPSRIYVGALSPGERLTLEGERVAGRRGPCTTDSVAVTSIAPFGIGRARRSVEVRSTTTVFPPWVPLSSSGPRASAPASVARSRPRRGTGAEYLGIREYRWGDSMRHVHWPSTARTGSVMVREFEEEQRPGLEIVVDTFADRGVEHTPLDRACAVAASIAIAGVREGLDVRLVAAVEGQVSWCTDADPHRIRHWLADLPRAGGRSADLLLTDPGVRPDGRGGVVLVAPTWRANASERLSAALGGQSAGHVIVVLVNVEAFAGDPSAPLLSSPETARLADVLRSKGAEVFLIGPDDDLGRLLGGHGGWVA